MATLSAFQLMVALASVAAVRGAPTLPNEPAFSADADSKTFTVTVEHNPALPAGSMETCAPPPGNITDDGLPMGVPRSFEVEDAPDNIKAMGVHHMTVDWQACGHPPLGVWTMPHYDLHFYTIPSAERKKILCGTYPMPGTPVCDKTEDPKDAKFFTEVTDATAAKVPTGFKADKHGVDAMGVHYFNPADQPAPGAWADPGAGIWLIYNGEYIGFEVMPPITWFSQPDPPKHTWAPTYPDESKVKGWMPVSFEISARGGMPKPTLEVKVTMKDFGSGDGAAGPAPAPTPEGGTDTEASGPAPAPTPDAGDGAADSARRVNSLLPTTLLPVFILMVGMLVRW